MSRGSGRSSCLTLSRRSWTVTAEPWSPLSCKHAAWIEGADVQQQDASWRHSKFSPQNFRTSRCDLPRARRPTRRNMSAWRTFLLPHAGGGGGVDMKWSWIPAASLTEQGETGACRWVPAQIHSSFSSTHPRSGNKHLKCEGSGWFPSRGAGQSIQTFYSSIVTLAK